MLFVAKKMLGKLLMPLPFGFMLCTLALVLYWQGSRRAAKRVLVLVLSGWFLLSLYPVAHWLNEPLEFQFPKYQGVPVSFVIVLGGGHRSDQRLPFSSLLSDSSLMRLTEGITIYHRNPGAKLLLSGYQGRDQISNAEAMARVAVELGIPAADIILETSPKDTAEEAMQWAQRLDNQPFALVTSAAHMPRAVYLFRGQGLDPIPAPTDYRSGGDRPLSWDSWLPDAGALELVTRAWHEYLGLFWAYLRS